MVIRLLFGLIFLLIIDFNSTAGTLSFLHAQNEKVRVTDAVYPTILDYSPIFEYPTSTIFDLEENDFHFYLVTVNADSYYLWIDKISTDIEIDLSQPLVNRSGIKMIPKSEWKNDVWSSEVSALQEVHEIDQFYRGAIDRLNELAGNDEQYRAENNYNTIVWDNRSAKRLYNVASESFTEEMESSWVYYSPAYIEFCEKVYSLYYQYFHSNAFKGLSKKEARARIETDFGQPESRVLVFHHFFRSGIPLKELEDSYEIFKGYLNTREKYIAEALIQKTSIQDIAKNQTIAFLFGIDIDGALESYFARDSSARNSVLVFWSFWDSSMPIEFSQLATLKSKYQGYYNFIHICIDAYEAPEKTRAFIYQNRAGGFHLLPEQSGAFRKSEYNKKLRIRDFPFYVIVDQNGEVLETESIPLQITDRLEKKLEALRQKK